MRSGLLRVALFGCLMFATAFPGKIAAREEEGFKRARDAMVENQVAARGVSDERVLEAMRRVPRHRMVPEDRRRFAYGDHPVDIGYNQTISQPYIVGYMTEQLQLEPEDKVLEIGTGSGYQAAILAEITPHVYSIEIVPELAASARSTLKELGYDQVQVRQGDGYHGWEEHAPWDAIIVTAAAEHIPPPLLRQLKPGGRMCIPVGAQFGVQYMLMVSKDEEGRVSTRNLMPVRFVPLTREED